ncbi:MAG: hypothetical protein ACREDM_00185 [Methylocella sp.]
MTGRIFKEDKSALRQTEQKPRLKWHADVWIALLGLGHLDRILSHPGTDDGEIVSAYFGVALAAAILTVRMWLRIKQHLNRT